MKLNIIEEPDPEQTMKILHRPIIQVTVIVQLFSVSLYQHSYSPKKLPKSEPFHLMNQGTIRISFSHRLA